MKYIYIYIYIIKRSSYKEYRYSAPPALLRVLLAQRNEPLGKPLRFFGLGPCGCDGFVLDERGNEVSKEGLSVRRLATQMAVFSCAAGHCVDVSKGREEKKEGKKKEARGLAERRNWIARE